MSYLSEKKQDTHLVPNINRNLCQLHENKIQKIHLAMLTITYKTKQQHQNCENKINTSEMLMRPEIPHLHRCKNA